jgi:signal transduction histidine kinase/CheY-like chemotaxis protein
VTPRLALRHFVVLIIVITVGTVIGIHDIAAYRALRASATEVASQRLRAAAGQIGQMLDTQSALMLEQTDTVARHPAVTAVLRSPESDVARHAAHVALEKGPLVRATSAAIEITDTAGNIVVSTTARPPVPESAQRATIALVSAARPVAVGPGVAVGDTFYYAAVARVSDGATPLGYVLHWRRLSTNARARQQLIDLIGPGSDFAAGNTTGPGWTDFVRAIPRPSLVLPLKDATWYTRDGGERRLAATRPIARTPWTLVVDFSEQTVMSGVGALVRRLVLITLALLAAGIAAAWLLARRLTMPLGELVAAAEGISGGDYSQRVPVHGTHEVRTLGSAFNAMSASIGTAHRALEEHSEELAERATQLSEQAAELEAANDELTSSIEEVVRARDELSASLATNARVTAELDASLAGAPVGIAVHDPDGRYRRVNATLATLNGAAPEAHVGRLPSAMAPGFGTAVERHVRQVLTTGTGVSNIELAGETAARPGVMQHWLASFYPIRTADGEMIGAGSVVADLTAYKRLESQLVQSQKMEAVGRLAGGVAHDFNNVLTAITGFGQFALSSLADGPAEAREDLEQVLAAADRAASLTRQLLAFSRQQVLQPRVINLNAVVTGLSPMLARLIGEDVKLIAKPAPALSAVKADPNQIEQVLVNLAVNARDAMPAGGTLVIETADVELDAAYAATRDGVTPGRYVMLAVTDTGTGMDAATRARVFDPFFTTKAPGKGTGLGLSTVYGILKQSGGNVDLYSEPGRGSTFKVYLPRTDEGLDGHPTPVSSAVVTPRGQLTVLLVDDDAFVAATARRALERTGYRVLAAGNGRHALGVVEQHAGPIDVLVTDLVMPEMGGRELARSVVAARPTVRVLYTSGYTAEAMNQQAVLEPTDAFLGKPFTPDSLLRAVQALVEPA